MTTEYDERKHLLDSNLHKELSIKFRCRFLPTTSLVSARFVAEKMARVAAFVVIMTVLLRLCVQPSHVSWAIKQFWDSFNKAIVFQGLHNVGAENVLKCMEETKVPDLLTLKQILEDQTGKYPQGNCVRKCLYEQMYLVDNNSEINVSSALSHSRLIHRSQFFRWGQSEKRWWGLKPLSMSRWLPTVKNKWRSIRTTCVTLVQNGSTASFQKFVFNFNWATANRRAIRQDIVS